MCCKGSNCCTVPHSTWNRVSLSAALYYDIQSQQKEVMASVIFSFFSPLQVKRSILTIPNYVGGEKNILWLYFLVLACLTECENPSEAIRFVLPNVYS